MHEPDCCCYLASSQQWRHAIPPLQLFVQDFWAASRSPCPSSLPQHRFSPRHSGNSECVGTKCAISSSICLLCSGVRFLSAANDADYGQFMHWSFGVTNDTSSWTNDQQCVVVCQGLGGPALMPLLPLQGRQYLLIVIVVTVTVPLVCTIVS